MFLFPWSDECLCYIFFSFNIDTLNGRKKDIIMTLNFSKNR